MQRYFEDLEIGATRTSGTLTVTEESIIAFGREYDPQTFHTDPEAAKSTIFGRLIASGWQTTAWTMRLIVESGGGGLGMGVDELRWKKPVFPGDTLHVVSEVLEKRPSATRPSGIVRMRFTTYNQNDEAVLTEITNVMFPRRPDAA
jgi:acyl dehydratase